MTSWTFAICCFVAGVLALAIWNLAGPFAGALWTMASFALGVIVQTVMLQELED